MIIQSLSSFCTFILFMFVAGGKISTEKCTQNLKRHIVNKLKPYQVVLLTKPESDSIEEHVIVSVLQNLPYIRIDLEKMSREDLKKTTKSPSFGIPRETSLFLLVTSFYKGIYSSNISSSLQYLTHLSPAKVRPKTLLILFTNRKSSLETFLHRMWLNQFLDFTVLEIRNEENNPHFQTFYRHKTLVHYYNPFNNNYVKKKCSSTAVWFPNKLLNLHGYLIKSGLHLKPPHSLAKYDKDGHLQSCRGADVEMFYTLSEVMNFSTTIQSDVNSTIGVFLGKKASGMLGLLISNAINILITTNINFRPAADGTMYEYSSTVEVESIVVLIPITHRNIEEQYLNVKVLYFKMFLFVGFVILMWALFSAQRCKNRDNNFWKPEYIAAILLGVTISRQPTLVRQRIFFLYLIVIGFYYSCSFLGGLTASQVKNSNEVKIDTFRDLAAYNVTVEIGPNYYRLLTDDSKDVQLLKQKMIQTEFADTKCILKLIKHMNVSCVILNAYARQLVELLRDSSGQPFTKILKQKLFNARRIIVLERSTPYKPRIDQLVTAFIEYGLRIKWERNISNNELMINIIKYDKKKSLQIDDLGAVSNIKRVLFFVALPCYLFSLLVFSAELLFNQLLNYVKKM